ncbi:MAG: methyltransferase domain-containing protein [Nitrospiraceae bacterium]|nr:methyltransferase domain-containing protein [Nitrospiraceae bacterium]
MSHVKVVTLPKIGDVPIVRKTKRDISLETPLDARDDESLGWGYWDRIWPSEVALSECLIHQFFPSKLQGGKVLEIGCGTGLAGVVAARLGAFTMFSDMVPITLEAAKESCRLNHISNFDTCLLNLTEKIEPKKCFYDLVIGSEVFYDEGILAGISHILGQVLTQKGKAMFCDPNRLGLDTVEREFKEKFIVAIEEIPLNWPFRKEGGVGKKGFFYQLSRRSQEAF